MDGTEINLKQNPVKKANFLSILLFWWMKDIFSQGLHSSLKKEDLYAPIKNDKSQIVTDELEYYWNNELSAANKENRKPKLLTAIRKCFTKIYMLWGLLVAFNFIVVRVSQPICLSYLISFFNPQSTMTSQEAWIWAAAVIGLSIVSMFMAHHAGQGQMVIGMRVRVACCSLIYRKILRLSRVSAGKTAAGQVINLLSNDVSRFDVVFFFLHYIWIMPIQAALISYVIYRSVGIAMFAGITAITIQSIPIQSYLGRVTAKLRLKIAGRTDERVRLMNELLNGVQVVKMYAWEEPFAKLVEKARRFEIKAIRTASYIRGVSLALMVFTERTTLFLTIVACVLLGQEIRAEVVFSLAQLYNILQLTMAIFYPMAVTFGGEALISVKRLQDFLLLEENTEIKFDEVNPKTQTSIDHKKNGQLPAEKVENEINKLNLRYIDEVSDTETEKLLTVNDKPQDKIKMYKTSDMINIKKCKASWQKDSIMDTLNLNWSQSRESFCAVVGSVGSGKTSLLQLLIKELPIKSGSVEVNGSISYSSQEAWLFSGTVKSNIIFGLPFDEKRYEEVIYSCALTRDLELFPLGDSTVVGDRGASLSGGQRARINLARAIYRDADVYLLDDPLSAVDYNVGQHIMKHCIGKEGFLQNKTRILCTHQLHLLETADSIVVLSNGQIEQMGTFKEVSSTDLFKELLQEHEESTKESGDEEHYESGSDVTSVNSPIRERSKSPASPRKEVIREPQEMQADFDAEEQISEGAISWRLYKTYFLAGGSACLLTILVILLIVAQSSTSGGDFWLTYWTNQVGIARKSRNDLKIKIDNESSNNTESNTTTTTAAPSQFINGGFLTQEIAIYVYAIFILGCIIFTTMRSILFFKVCMRASINLHNTMFAKILGAPMRFFDLNPSGRILNRFSKDIGAVDELLPRAMADSIQIFLVMVGIFVMIGLANPYIIVLVIPVGFLFLKIRSMYLCTAQDIRRLECTNRSPVFNHVTSTLSGLPTIRSANAQVRLIKQFDNLQDGHTSASFLSIAAGNSFGLWLDAISVTFVACVTFSFLLLNHETTRSGSVGLAISQALILTGMVQHGVRQTTEVVSQMTSVERVVDYMDIEQEKNGDSEPDSTWPSKGKLEFKKTSLRYNPNGAPVLQELDITIEPGWKVGIVGRTGAGKSSIIAALFRLAHTDGHICIDDLDTGLISLKSLRSKISIIPQDSVLFCDTMRYNLDPFDIYSDAELWSALDDVEMRAAIPDLAYSIAESGSNLSAGQRQLVCLARAILRKNNILVLDEATANVDTRTDSLIQTTIKKKFSNCTVITIAHRLNTVMNSDRILVLDAGRCIEWGTPHELLGRRDSVLKAMWDSRQLNKS